jgi:hypothetical protein
LQALTWIAPGHEVEALSEQPAMCPKAGGTEPQAMVGRALFNAPMLLGGQAARADVSCASCHSNGRRNGHFFLAGVSSAPGTADVSSSFFSPARANGRFDPKPIPDLAMPGKVSRDPSSGDLERFLRGLIVEEFSGPEPSQRAISALAAFVRSVGSCGEPANQPRTMADQIWLVRQSVLSAGLMAQLGERESAAVLVSGARHQLGLIDERLAGPALSGERRILLSASRDLQPIAGSGATDPGRLERWLSRFDRRMVLRLRQAEARSLYNPERLALWLR